MASRHSTSGTTTRRSTAARFTGILLGIGIAGFIDETLFHQLLQWHTFYWATDQHGRILSDGLFHAASTIVLLWGTYRLWNREPDSYRTHMVIGGILLGGGGFNAYDGIVQHLILHLHLVNEGVCASPQSGDNSILTCPADLPYEVVWIVLSLVMVGGGIALSRRDAHAESS